MERKTCGFSQITANLTYLVYYKLLPKFPFLGIDVW